MAHDFHFISSLPYALPMIVWKYVYFPDLSHENHYFHLKSFPLCHLKVSLLLLDKYFIVNMRLKQILYELINLVSINREFLLTEFGICFTSKFQDVLEKMKEICLVKNK